MTSKLAAMIEQAEDESAPEPEWVYPEEPELDSEECEFCRTHAGAVRH